MSMSLLSILQCLWAFLAYTFVTVAIPAIVFGKIFKKFSIVQRFMMYFTIGNFYVMNLVFVLELLHISNKFTLLLGTIIPAILTYSKINKISIRKKLLAAWKVFESIVNGHLGVKTAVFRFFSGLTKILKKAAKKLKQDVLLNWLDWLLLLGITLIYIRIYGSNLVTNFGYPYSDLPVHNYWINYLGQNQIFVAGIYPFGFHCIMYYIHELFGLDVYVLLRVFFLAQTFYVNLMILTFLKQCCKTKFTPYIGMFIYVATNIYATATYSRFVGTLPQEFGMIFIFPCGYFAFEFFRERKKELLLEKKLQGKGKKIHKREKRHLKQKDNLRQKQEYKDLDQEYIDLDEIYENSTKLKKNKKLGARYFSLLYLFGFILNLGMVIAVAVNSPLVKALSQKYAIIFAFPCLYFIYEFFRERKKERVIEKKLAAERKKIRLNKKQERKELKELKKADKKEQKIQRAEIKEAKKNGEKIKKNGEKIKKKKFKLGVFKCFSTWYLAGFAMNFAMTLAVHFYGTMIAGMFAVGIAVGFAFRFLRPKYFLRVVSTCAISVFVAVLPMVIAFAMGTPLQGSLGWGMNVLTGKNNNTASEQNSQMTIITTEQSVQVSAQSVVNISGSAANASAQSVNVSGSAANASAQSVNVSGSAANASAQSFKASGDNAVVSDDVIYYYNEYPVPLYFDRIGFVKMKKIADGGELNLIKDGIHYFYNTEELKYKRSLSFYVGLLKNNPKLLAVKVKKVLKINYKKIIDATANKVFVNFNYEYVEYFYMLLLIMFGVGILLIICRQPDYGAAIVSTVVFAMCMALLQAASRIGLPTLMDSARCSIYFSYMTALVFALAVDMCVFIVFGWLKWKWVKWIKHMVAFVCLVAVVAASFKFNLFKQPYYLEGLETNEAITCLTNIINEDEDFKWTICSANDETRMVDGHGYHYETIEFLREMESMDNDTMLTIPTETVYFFVEKIPITYNNTSSKRGAPVSKERAANALPVGKGISIYKMEKREIVMSRMYYWAQEFQKLYPNEMKVYMENDNFVCYKIKQNPYRLYNFAVDYDFNMRSYDKEEDAKNGIT